MNLSDLPSDIIRHIIRVNREPWKFVDGFRLASYLFRGLSNFRSFFLQISRRWDNIIEEYRSTRRTQRVPTINRFQWFSNMSTITITKRHISHFEANSSIDSKQSINMLTPGKEWNKMGKVSQACLKESKLCHNLQHGGKLSFSTMRTDENELWLNNELKTIFGHRCRIEYCRFHVENVKEFEGIWRDVVIERLRVKQPFNVNSETL